MCCWWRVGDVKGAAPCGLATVGGIGCPDIVVGPPICPIIAPPGALIGTPLACIMPPVYGAGGGPAGYGLCGPVGMAWEWTPG